MTATVDTAMLTTPQVVRHTGISFRQLHYWIGWGVIEPVTEPGRPARGAGARFLWDRDEVRVARVADLMLGWMPVRQTQGIAGFFGGNWPLIRQLVRAHRTGFLLITCDGRVGVTDEPAQLYRWQQAAAVSITVNLASVE